MSVRGDAIDAFERAMLDAWLALDPASINTTIVIETNGHTFRLTPTNMLGCDSGRRRWRVACATCDVMLHEATTGAAIRAIDHAMSP